MLSFHSLVTSFRKLGLNKSPVIAHTSLSAFGSVQGGADTVVGAILSVFPTVIMPTFTYKTMIVPEVGPPNNGITYGSGNDINRKAEFYRPDMPVDRLMGIVPETLRLHQNSLRSIHPIYSFSGMNTAAAIKAQTLENPFGPIEMLANSGGWVLLLGVDHTANTSIHFAEQQVGRKQFVRWALTPHGIIPCPRWPGCSYGFNAVSPRLRAVTRKINIGQALVQAIPLKDLIKIVDQMIFEDPFALLCTDLGCERCQAVRNSHKNQPN
jgi:aminoglycoside 3-N-acetyltransferase